MIQTLGFVVVAIYMVTLSLVSVFCLMQLHLLVKYIRLRDEDTDDPINELTDFPMVTIQLPIFNEQFVVERLIENITQIDYPIERLQIQVIDDSTDDTLEISRQQVALYKSKGFDIQLLHRTDRSGYKAGALKAAMPEVKGEFIAIFDADFLPKQEFLKKTIPHFANPEVGVVQTRWGHINPDYSILTRLQAFQLNVHFTVEQCGRDLSNYLLQFNGTAGVWRKATIESAGGWESDTLTEDLDLSYRAQMKKWKIKYLEDIVSPAELPTEISAFKSQQYRWMKGGAETAKKLVPTVMRSNLPFRQKVHAFIHLMGSTVFLAILVLSLSSVPIIHYIGSKLIDPIIFTPFIISTIAIVLVYLTAYTRCADPEKSFLYHAGYFLVMFPVFLSLSMAMAFHNSIAVISGYRGKKSEFVRTPKYNIVSLKDKLKPTEYINKKFDKTIIVEILLGLVFVGAVLYSINFRVIAMLPLHLALSIGYLTIAFLGLSKPARA